MHVFMRFPMPACLRPHVCSLAAVTDLACTAGPNFVDAGCVGAVPCKCMMVMVMLIVLLMVIVIVMVIVVVIVMALMG